MAADRDNNTITTINWNDVIKHDTRSIDDVDLGKVKGLYEPFIVIERGTINKEKLYIPKSLIEKYDAGVLYLGITEQEAKDTYARESPPTEDEIKLIDTITENRIMASRRSGIEITEREVGSEGEGEEEQRQLSKTEETKMMVGKKVKEFKENLIATTSSTNISTPRINEEEIIKKLKQAASELKDILISGAKVAKKKIKEGKDITEEKIKEQQEAAEERKAENDAKKISEMGDLAIKFSSSFDDILSEISLTRTYAEQEQIYKGFIKLIGLQRKLLVARKELAAKLKDSVQEPVVVLNKKIKQQQPQLTQGKQKHIPKTSKLPMPKPQLPEIASIPETTTEKEEKIKSKSKSKPQIIKTVGEKDSNIEVTSDGGPLSAAASLSSDDTMTTSTAESPSTEIPSTEITSTKTEEREKEEQQQ